jgi:hypothetical protein
MADPNLTPEEKLLRIIESPSQIHRGLKISRRSGEDLKIFFKLLKAKYGDKLKEYFNARTANALLLFFSCLVTVYLVFDFSMGMPRSTHVDRLEMLARKIDIGDLSLGQLDPLAVYLQEITQRNIFALPEPAPVAGTAAEPVVKAPVVDLNSLTAGLKVVGIIWSETPQVILEDTVNGKTLLLNRGSKVKEARVKEILKDRVILSYDNQDVELR